MTVVGPEEYILPSIWVAIFIEDVVELFASPTACVDKDIGAGEHIIDFLQGPDTFSDKIPSKRGDLLAQIWQVTRGINNDCIIGPAAVEIGWVFSRI